MHAIYVRDLRSRLPGAPLAVDIEDEAMADRLVASIAQSYAQNGCETGTGARWFRDGRRIYRIWSVPAEAMAALSQSAVPAGRRDEALRRVRARYATASDVGTVRLR